MRVENNQVAMNNRPNNNIASYTIQSNRTRSEGALRDEDAVDALDGGEVRVVFKMTLSMK
jgi:hypothetical protein